jgi:ERCC4-related helicase
MKKQDLIEKLLTFRAVKDSQIDLNAYAIGLNDMYEALNMRVVGVTFTEKEKQILEVLLKLDIHKVKTYNANDKNFEEYVNQENKLIEKIKSLP